ncbi:MAG: TolC family protein, partial [Planctomycetota bacterium]|nr:TolC family protein [Planctomycetota bacterium]
PSLWLSREGDSNSFLIYNQWATAGMQAAWDLLSLPRRRALFRQAVARREHARSQRLALAAGILTQVHLAAIEVEDAAEQYRLARQLHAAREKQLEAVKRRVQSGEAGQHTALRLEAETLIAKIRMLTAFADLQVAQARLHNSLGREEEAPPTDSPAEILPGPISAEEFAVPDRKAPSLEASEKSPP